MKNLTTYKKCLICSLLVAAGCSRSGGLADGVEMASLGSVSGTAQVKVNMQISDSSSKVIYNDASASSSLVLKAGQNYTLNLTPSSSVSGAVYSLLLTQTSSVNANSSTIPLNAGANSFSVPAQGDYSLKLSVTAPSMMPLTKYYNASVTCANPSFTADSLDGSKISAVADAGNNMFKLSAPGLAAGANGQAPYSCAWDGTGTGIIDTAFGDCDAGVDFYSNLVASRKISVVVKDSCNMVYTVSKTVSLPYTIPAQGAGNVFISGAVSGATGVAVGDSRADGVQYLATNSGGNNIVQPNYTNSTFSIDASMFYNQASSVKFGINIQLVGVKGTVDAASGSGSVDVSAATIKSVTFSTDQAGDAKVPLSFSGSSCVLSNQNAKVQFVSGTPCTVGTGTGNKATVEVWGDYTCSALSSTGGTINLSGKFDGMQTLVDSCSGGGGGGGGIAPIQL